MTELSPAARAVLGAYELEALDIPPRLALAAALHAAADQIDWDWEPCSQLLAIAAELEGR